MESESNQSPLIVLVGETASGKTALAIELARLYDGEIIAADSRTVYKGADVGTAKPTKEEMSGITHHLLNVVTPDQPFTAAEFKRLATDAIASVAAKGKMPILVGGSGLYIDAVIYDFAFGAVPDPKYREYLQTLSVAALQKLVIEKGIAMPTNNLNPRHLVRAIEMNGAKPTSSSLRENTLVLGLQIDRDVLKEKLARRVDAMIDHGLVVETRTLTSQYGWDAPGLQSTSYKAFRKYIEGDATLEQAKALFIQNDSQLAKRQRTWFRRNKNIHWICKKEEAVELITTFLNNIPTAK